MLVTEKHLKYLTSVNPVFSTSAVTFPGWLDNFNGAVGIMLGFGKGIIRTMLADPKATHDYVPVDICI